MRALAFEEVGGVSGGWTDRTDDDFYRPFQEPGSDDYAFRAGAGVRGTVRNALVGEAIIQGLAFAWKSLTTSNDLWTRPYGRTDGPGSTFDGGSGEGGDGNG